MKSLHIISRHTLLTCLFFAVLLYLPLSVSAQSIPFPFVVYALPNLQATTVATSTSFAVRDRIQTKERVNVRATAGGSVVGSQEAGVTGTIIGGPTTLGGYSDGQFNTGVYGENPVTVWWNIDYASGSDGWSTQEFLEKVSVVPAPPNNVTAPAVRLVSSLATVRPGQSAALTWSATNASECTGIGFDTNKKVEGQVTVQPQQTTTYTITCNGVRLGALARATTTIQVTATTGPALKPSVSLTASSRSITAGDVVTIQWSSQQADFCRSSDFPSSVVTVDVTGDRRLATSGSFSETLTRNKTYRITCTGQGGRVSERVAVSVQTTPVPVATSSPIVQPTLPTPTPTPPLVPVIPPVFSPEQISRSYKINIAGTEQDLLRPLTFPTATIEATPGAWVPILQGTPGNDVFDGRNYGGRVEFHSNGGDDAIYMSKITGESIHLPSDRPRGVITVLSRHGWGFFTLQPEADNLIHVGSPVQHLGLRGNDRNNILVTTQHPTHFDPRGGRNTVVLGPGRDRVTLTRGSTNTVINFDTRTSGGDIIQLAQGTFASYRELKAALRQDKENAVLNLPSGDSVTFVGRGITAFAPAHFEALSSDWRDSGAVLGISTDDVLLSERLSIRSSGEEVRRLQVALAQLGYYTEEQTGYFGTYTEDAVRAFQTDHGLPALGIVGPQTRSLLNSSGVIGFTQ